MKREIERENQYLETKLLTLRITQLLCKNERSRDMLEASKMMQQYCVLLNCNILLPMGQARRFKNLVQEGTDLLGLLNKYVIWLFLRPKQQQLCCFFFLFIWLLNLIFFKYHGIHSHKYPNNNSKIHSTISHYLKGHPFVLEKRGLDSAGGLCCEQCI